MALHGNWIGRPAEQKKAWWRAPCIHQWMILNECQHLPPQAALNLRLCFLDFLWLIVCLFWGEGQGQYCFSFFLRIGHLRIGNYNRENSDSIYRPLRSCNYVTFWKGSVIAISWTFNRRHGLCTVVPNTVLYTKLHSLDATLCQSVVIVSDAIML